MLRQASLALLICFTSSAAMAGDYGMRGAELAFSKDHAAVTGDFKVGPAHSLQMTGIIEKLSDETVASLVGHLHLEPQFDRRYGFVLGVMDIDERSSRAGMVGLSGRQDIMLFDRAGYISAVGTIGQATGSLDFVSLQGNAKIEASENVSFGLGLRAAEFDQTQFDFISWGVDLSTSWNIKGTGIELELRGSREGLSGRGGAAPENRVSLTASYHFGKEKYRTIQATNPVEQLVRFDKF